jgi:hypothetical protein
MEIKLKDPIRSLKAKLRTRSAPHPSGKPRNVTKKCLGSVLPGDPARNPEGKGGYAFNPTNKQLIARARFCIQRGQRTNPHGMYGFKPHGIKKVDKRKRTPEEEQFVKTAREINELFKECVPEGIQAIRNILNNPRASDTAKIAALALCVERGYGKVAQTNINANIDADSKPSELNGDELNARIAETLERAERITKRTREPITRQERPADLRKLN